jgi:hypothetical protein
MSIRKRSGSLIVVINNISPKIQKHDISLQVEENMSEFDLDNAITISHKDISIFSNNKSYKLDISPIS